MKFLEAGKLLPPLAGSPNWLPLVSSEYENFLSVTNLAIGLNVIPAYSGWATQEWLVAEHNAEVYIRSLVTPVSSWQLSQARAAKVNELVDTALNIPVDDARNKIQFVTEFIQRTIQGSASYMHGLFHNLLKSIVIQSWTAMEVLVEDLFLKIEEKHSTLMTLPVPDKIRGFGSRAKFRGTYDYAFNRDAAIQAALAHESIDALQLLRNVLVHSNGIADEALMGKKCYPVNSLLKGWFPGLKKDDDILLDGVIVSEIINLGLAQAHPLASAMDDWLRAKGITS